MTSSFRTSNWESIVSSEWWSALERFDLERCRLARYTVQVKRIRMLTRIPEPSMMRSRVGLYVVNGKFVRNPREPREKERIGGTMRWNNQDV